MNQSLDGYVDHMAFAPSPTLFRHFIEQMRNLTGSVYGRHVYEVMRCWDMRCSAQSARRASAQRIRL
jgi:hypothetical protein